MNRVENEKKCNMKMMQYQKKNKKQYQKNSTLGRQCHAKKLQHEKSAR